MNVSAKIQHAVTLVRAALNENAAERANRVYVESSPCVVMRAVDLSTLIPARFSSPRTIHEYLT
jgi:hypothetical protein